MAEWLPDCDPLFSIMKSASSSSFVPSLLRTQEAGLWHYWCLNKAGTRKNPIMGLLFAECNVLLGSDCDQGEVLLRLIGAYLWIWLQLRILISQQHTAFSAENKADRSNIDPPASGLLPAMDQSFVKSPVRWNYSGAGCPVRWRQGSWVVQAPRLQMYPQCVADASRGGRFPEHMQACCCVSQKTLARIHSNPHTMAMIQNDT